MQTVSTTTPSPIQAESVSAFINSIGVVTHLNYDDDAYATLSGQYVSEFQYLGLDVASIAAEMDFGNDGGGAYAREVEAAMAQGIKFNLVIGPNAYSVSQYIDIFNTLEQAHPGSIIAITGQNEVPVASLPTVQAFQAQLYAAVRADPLLNGVPVYNYTIYSMQASTFTLEGNVSSTANFGNTHAYSADFPPQIYDSWFVPLGLAGTPNDPYVVTETGYPNAPIGVNGNVVGENQDVDARYGLDNVFDMLLDGANKVYVYELLDEANDPTYTVGSEDNFGFFNYQGQPKEIGAAMHNLTTIIADTGPNAANFTPGTLSYSVTGLNSTINPAAAQAAFNNGIFDSYIASQPVYGSTYLLAKSNGDFDIAVWREPEIWDDHTYSQISAPAVPVTITLGTAAATVEVFDPLAGTSPIATYANVSTVTLGVSDHPLIVEVDPFTNAAPPPPVASAPPAPTPDPSAPTTVSSSSPTATVTVGSGPDSVGLLISEDAYQGDAQFTVAVNGAQIGGVLTATAQYDQGQTQVFAINGNFGGGAKNVTVTFVNDSYGGSPTTDRNLYVLGAAYDGVAAPSSAAVLLSNGPQSITVGSPVPSAIVTGTGKDTLALTMSEQAFAGDAQFTISVNGVQIGGVQTATAVSTLGERQVFDVEGNFAAGANTVSINLVNANAVPGYPLAARAIYLNGANIDGNNVAAPALALTNSTAQSFTFNEPGSVASGTPSVIGTGPNTLALFMSERSAPNGAQYTVSVDGQQIGGVQTTTANSLSGQTQELDVEGNFGAGNHSVAVNYLNASNSLLYVNTATINGNTVANSQVTLNNNGAMNFNFATPGTPITVAAGSGPDSIGLSLSEDYYQGNAQFTVDVDGQQVGGTGTVTAIHGNNQSQIVNIRGNFSGAHTVAINFINDAAAAPYVPDLDRNLYVGGATIDGVTIANSDLTLLNTGTKTFSFSH